MSVSEKPTPDALLAAIRRLPLSQRLQIIERAAHEAASDLPALPKSADVPKPSLLGLMSGELQLADEICSMAYLVRNTAKERAFDE